MAGSTATALGPTSRSSVGTSRQPSSCWPSSATSASKRRSTAPRSGASRGRNTSPTPYAPFGRQREGRHLAEEPVGHLQQDAGAVAGVGLAAARAAVPQVHQHLQRLLHDRVGTAPLDVDDEADAAGVVLVPGMRS